jgi:hypothetical protein
MDKLKNQKDKILIVLLVISLAWAALSSFLFFSDYGRLHRGGLLPGRGAWHMPHPPRQATEADIERLQPWMTFAFVNKIFNLPPEFLKESLYITNEKYPNLTIDAAAKEQRIESAPYLLSLKTILSVRIALPVATTSP